MKGLKWLGILAGMVLLLVLASFGFRAVQERGIAGKLAKLRQMGHPTTMAELNSWYAEVPAESNAAIGLLAAMEMFPSAVPDKLPIFGDKAARVEHFEPWAEEAKSLAADFVSSNAPAYAALSHALKLPGSRYPVTFSPTWSMDHLSLIKSAAQRLALAAQWAAENGKPEDATAAIEDGFRVGRTLEPEPIFISALVRVACNAIAVSSCERVMNRMPLRDSQLAGLQAQIVATLSTNCMERAFAGETAYGLELFTMPSSQWQATMGGGFATTPGESIKEMLYAWSGLAAADHDCYLDAMIRLQEAAREDFPQRLNSVSNIAHEVVGDTNGFPFVKAVSRMLIPSLAKTFQRDASNTASLRCALAALGVERFRIAHDGKLPATLAELVPQYLTAVPADPFDGKPLRFRPLEKGFVVYSLGEDGDDDGGRPRKSGQKAAGDYDVTFRIER